MLIGIQIIVFSAAAIGFLLPWLHERLIDRWVRNGSLPGYMDVEDK